MACGLHSVANHFCSLRSERQGDCQCIGVLPVLANASRYGRNVCCCPDLCGCAESRVTAKTCGCKTERCRKSTKAASVPMDGNDAAHTKGRPQAGIHKFVPLRSRRPGSKNLDQPSTTTTERGQTQTKSH